ncbi:hypothetical protein DY000_02031073 [Brassica cretica]|uniref:Aspartic peptidase DDI1-type domain-containing protein n=1 Tax=Brassica cretica TaxID=69181 RepID=A0ABQ7DRE1_BRACR|nr:hypothetical protein DY000_02031073 [Brassica cretica]
MEEDKVPIGRTLRRRKEKVAKHLKRGANDKEKESFWKRVFRIPIDKPFEDAYYTHRLWMFFRETREKEEDIRRMFCEATEKMRMRITLKKKSDPGQFAIPCTVKGIEFPHALCDTRSSVNILPRVMADHLDLLVQIGNALVPVDFHVLDIKLNWNSSLLLGRAFLSTYDPIPVKTPHTISRRINDPGIIAACHCGEDYETDYLASIETHTATSINSGHQKSNDIPHDESVDSRQNDWDSDYYNPIMAVNDAPAETPIGLDPDGYAKAIDGRTRGNDEAAEGGDGCEVEDEGGAPRSAQENSGFFEVRGRRSELSSRSLPPDDHRIHSLLSAQLLLCSSKTGFRARPRFNFGLRLCDDKSAFILPVCDFYLIRTDIKSAKCYRLI